MRAHSPVLKFARTAGIAIVAVALVTFIVLPGLVIGAFFLRPIALVLALAGLVALAVSPRFRQWLGLETAPPFRPEGVNLPDDVSIHPHHAWAARVGRAKVHAGVDHLLQRALGPVEQIVTPPPGTSVVQGEPLFRLRAGGRSVEVQAPVSGVVRRSNPELAEQPELLALDPYVGGWVVELEAPRYPEERLYLHRHPESWSFLAEELERLLSLAHPPRAAQPLMNDGGDLAPTFHDHVDDRAWKKINTKLFGAR